MIRTPVIRRWVASGILFSWLLSLAACGVQGTPIPPEEVKKQRQSSSH
ncbi:MAG: hypothetical protein M1297_10580 [Nitrospirae bacterium]|nr:hypothetical protein [Nitrospirota bacterium]